MRGGASQRCGSTGEECGESTKSRRATTGAFPENRRQRRRRNPARWTWAGGKTQAACLTRRLRMRISASRGEIPASWPRGIDGGAGKGGPSGSLSALLPVDGRSGRDQQRLRRTAQAVTSSEVCSSLRLPPPCLSAELGSNRSDEAAVPLDGEQRRRPLVLLRRVAAASGVVGGVATRAVVAGGVVVATMAAFVLPLILLYAVPEQGREPPENRRGFLLGKTQSLEVIESGEEFGVDGAAKESRPSGNVVDSDGGLQEIESWPEMFLDGTREQPRPPPDYSGEAPGVHPGFPEEKRDGGEERGGERGG
nr:hypothetical protein DVH24_034846 [Ipomoea batatas]